MTYMLQALVAKSGAFPKDLPHSLRVVALEAGVEMIPLTDDVLRGHGLPSLPLTDEGFAELPEVLTVFCSAVGKNGSIAYIEAEYFGGVGMQASCLFLDGVLMSEPLVSDDAINRALRVLGVAGSEACDEFDSIGLGRKRHTNKWIE
ncbi:MAG: hypothetical protein ACKOF9_07205 [Burkholderiales bacterium]